MFSAKYLIVMTLLLFCLFNQEAVEAHFHMKHKLHKVAHKVEKVVHKVEKVAHKVEKVAHIVQKAEDVIAAGKVVASVIGGVVAA